VGEREKRGSEEGGVMGKVWENYEGRGKERKWRDRICGWKRECEGARGKMIGEQG